MKISTKEYSSKTAANYQTQYYYINKVRNAILKVVKEDNYRLFLFDFQISPHFKKHIQ